MTSRTWEYARPREVASLDDCYFYHSMDLPGHGAIGGEWDLRGREQVYLGGIELAGKTVLEVGPASGALTFWMERQGAEVTAYDLTPEHDQDLVPYAGSDLVRERAAGNETLRLFNNAFWFAHAAMGSAVRVVNGTVYDIPADLGPVDIATVCSVLIHTRDPFQALERASAPATETMVVTDVLVRPRWHRVLGRFQEPRMQFLPDPADPTRHAYWWTLPPELVQRMLGVLGFGRSTVTLHEQPFADDRGQRPVPLYTVVAHRTQPLGPR